MTDAQILPHIENIDLALSGGGFRATLFHLGVIGYLRERQNLLERVRTVCSVSGGSILAAHLVINWPEYTGKNIETFRERARAIVEEIRTRNITLEVMGQSRMRLLQLCPLDSEFLAGAYAGMLKAKSTGFHRWDDLPPVPELHVLATHLNTGRPCAFSAKGFRVLQTSPDETELNALSTVAEQAKINHQEIARAVAASSAFPPVFSPLPLDAAHPLQLLTDGGVYDNSGVNYLRHLYEVNHWTSAQNRLVIMSDAGRRFPAELGKAYESMLGLGVRVTDAQGNRIAESDSEAAKAYFEQQNIPVVKVSIHDRVKAPGVRPSAHSDRVQDLLTLLRTELDDFTTEECLALYRHGFLTTQQAMATHTRESAFQIPVPWTPVDHVQDESVQASSGESPALVSEMEKEALEEKLSNGHLVKNQRYLATLFAKCLTVAILALLLLGATIGGGAVWLREAREVSVAALPTGRLPIEVRPYTTGSWVDRFEALRNIIKQPGTHFALLVTSDTILKLANQQPYAGTAVRVSRSGLLEGVMVSLYVEEKAVDGTTKYIALANENNRPDRLLIPNGVGEARVLGLVFSAIPIDVETVKQMLILEVEKL